MSNPITKIEVDCFKGATQASSLTFDPGKDFTILFGENRSGKSTILDAIDVVCNGTVGALADISVGQNPAKYLKSLGVKKGPLQATVHSGEEWWRATMRGSKVDVTGEGTKPKVSILRRKKIADLITAQPKDRYDRLKRFIDTAVIERSEDTLQAKRNQLEDVRNEQEIRRSEKLALLEQLWEGEGRPSPWTSPLDWASAKTGAGTKKLESDLSNMNNVVSAMKAAIKDFEDCISSRSALDSHERDIVEIERKIRGVPDVKAETASKLVDSLIKAKDYIDAETDLKKCPTCLRSIGRDELSLIVDGQLDEMGELKTLVDNKVRIEKNRDLAQTETTRRLAQLTESMRRFQQNATSAKIPEIQALGITWPDWSALSPKLVTLESIVAKLKTTQPQLEKKRDDLQRDVNQFNSIAQPYRGFEDASQKLDELNAICNGLAVVYEKMHEQRVSFVQDILDSIVGEANRLYWVIHPSEEIGLAKLEMDDKRRGSVDQTGEFHEHSRIKPQAILSESHLDTLGFCVWMALARREHPEKTVLLIDDIFTSVDSQHVRRIVDLLAEESGSFLQVIIATHFRLWWDRCQNAQGVERLQLGRWTLAEGIIVQNAPVEFARLRELADQGVVERQATASKAGVMLESILDDLTILYRQRLPRDGKGEYTLGELLDACRNLFAKNKLEVQIDANWDKDGQKQDQQSTNPKSAFERIVALKFIRNQVGCHFSLSGTEIPDEEVREFGRATADFIESMTCPNCGHLASKPTTDGKFLRCTCKKQAVRMTPVIVA